MQSLQYARPARQVAAASRPLTDSEKLDCVTNDKEPPLTVKQVRERLSCSRKTIYTLFDKGDLEGFWLGSERRIYPESVQEYIERNSNKKARPQVPTPEAKPSRSKRNVSPGEQLRYL
jgi:excisionase family DNA binding protein